MLNLSSDDHSYKYPNPDTDPDHTYKHNSIPDRSSMFPNGNDVTKPITHWPLYNHYEAWAKSDLTLTLTLTLTTTRHGPKARCPPCGYKNSKSRCG